MGTENQSAFQSEILSLISVSTGWLPRLEERPYYDLSSALRVMMRMSEEGLADGCEFGLLPEWDSENAPLTPCMAPTSCEKHSLEEILAAINQAGLKVLTVHANRDVGSYLCHTEQRKQAKGVRLVEEALKFCRSLKCNICVFHFWDPWRKTFDAANLYNVYQSVKKSYPDIHLSIENIPTIMKGKSPFSIMDNYDWWTLDLKWASMFGEFEQFLEQSERLDNIHIQGEYQNSGLVSSSGKLDYDAALETLLNGGYSGPFTVELEGMATHADISICLRSLKDAISRNL